MVVWDGAPGDGPGGTASTVERWSRLQMPLQIIDPLRVGEAAAKSRARRKKTPARAPGLRRGMGRRRVCLANHGDALRGRGRLSAA